MIGSEAIAADEEPQTIEEFRASIKELKARFEQQKQLDELEERASRQQLNQQIKEIVAEIKKEDVPEVLEWLKGLKVSADLRLRYEGAFRDSAVSNGKDRHRGRFRLRLGAKKKMAEDQVEIGFRLASGGATRSTNQTFDNNFNGKDVFIDRAYAEFKPKAVKGFTFTGGKMANPLVHTDMIWDSDVNPEGVWSQYALSAGGISPFVSVGYFIIDEDNATPISPHDTTLLSAQAGFKAKPAKDVSWTTAVTNYYFDYHGPGVGAGFLAGVAPRNFKLLNITNKVRFKIAGHSFGAFLDFVHNCGNDDTRRRFSEKDDGVATGVSIGSNKKKGDFSAKYKFAYIEPNATVPTLADGDFGLGTGTNVKGHKVSVKYNVTDNWTIGGAVFCTEAIVGSSNTDHKLVQVDLIWKL